MLTRKIALLCFAIVAANMAFAQGNLKIAFVNTQKVLAKASMAQQLGAQLEAEIKKRTQEIKALETELNNARQQAVKERLSMSVKKQEEVETSLLKKDRELRFKKAALEEDVKLTNAKVTRKLEDSLLRAARDIAEKEGYDVILTENNLLYISKRIDITDKVIEQLK